DAVADPLVELFAGFERQSGGFDRGVEGDFHAPAGANDDAALGEELAGAAGAEGEDRQAAADRQRDAAFLELVHLSVGAAGSFGVEEDADALRRAFGGGVDRFDGLL